MKIDKNIFSNLTKIIPTKIADNRGDFSRIFCQEQLQTILDKRTIKQINFSKTKIKGSVRGLHYQKPPNCELKIVYCLKGVIFDVIVDVRKGSDTFLNWHSEELNSKNLNAIIIPEGFAHGFQTLSDNVEILYIHTASYVKSKEAALNYNDPKLDISWPLKVSEISNKDLTHPLIQSSFRGIDI